MKVPFLQSALVLAMAASSKIGFSTSIGGVTPVDDSITSPNAFVGATLRPKLSDRWTLITRADIGGGDADLTCTWAWASTSTTKTRSSAGTTLSTTVRSSMDFHWGSR